LAFSYKVDAAKEFIVLNPNIRNLIFDLGGVILDLDVPATLKSFSRLSGIPEAEVQEIFKGEKGFEEYEMGRMDDGDFRNFIRDVYRITVSNDQIDGCWNAMLRGIPIRKLELLESLKSHYNVFLLSNTNNIHHEYINKTLMPSIVKGKVLEDYFHKAYYSHRMLKRKPNPDIYLQVLDENGFIPMETLFLDDNAANVEGARGAGIEAVFVNTRDFILDYFK
jgi:putative hydrolase of the HAD superfamily